MNELTVLILGAVVTGATQIGKKCGVNPLLVVGFLSILASSGYVILESNNLLTPELLTRFAQIGAYSVAIYDILKVLLKPSDLPLPQIFTVKPLYPPGEVPSQAPDSTGVRTMFVPPALSDSQEQDNV